MLDFAIFYVPKRVYIFDRNQKQQDQQKNDATEREMERQSVLLGLLCLLLTRLLKAL